VNLKSAKLMGGIGAILTLCVFIPILGWLLAIAGLVLILIALRNIAEVVKENKIFSNYLIGALLKIVDVFILIFGLVIIIVRGLIPIGTWNWMSTEWSSQYIGPWSWESIGIGVLIGIIVLILVFWAINIIGALLIKSSFDKISDETGEKNFRIAGLLLLIGAIIPLIGAVVEFVGNIFEIVSFFSIPDNIEKKEKT
jgi:uncharacterized membrane protein